MRLSLILLSFNRLDQLKRAMPSIKLHDCDEFIFADGGSTDGTIEWLLQQSYPMSHPIVPVIVEVPQGEPHQYAKTANMGVAAATGDVIVLQGAEIVHESDALQQIKRHFDQWPGGILVTPYAITYEQFGVRPHEWSRSRRYCLYAMYRDDYVAIGGNNEYYTQWGNVDYEFEVRCKASGYMLIDDPQIKLRHLAHVSDGGDAVRWLEEHKYMEDFTARIEAGEANPVLPWGY